MYKHLLKVLASLLVVAFAMAGCNSGDSSQAFRSKNDSLQFARTVMQQYGRESVLLTQEQDSAPRASVMGVDSMQPITWKTYLKYKDYYDKNPLIFNPNKQAYKGYTIDAVGYARLLNNAAIKGLYLRLGRRDDGSYTIMILGTDANGQVLSSSDSLSTEGDGDSNFDNILACPTNCPSIENP